MRAPTGQSSSVCALFLGQASEIQRAVCAGSGGSAARAAGAWLGGIPDLRQHLSSSGHVHVLRVQVQWREPESDHVRRAKVAYNAAGYQALHDRVCLVEPE